MEFHNKHLPTFVRAWSATHTWYTTARAWEKFFAQLALGLVVVWGLYYFFAAPPAGFPQGAYVTVDEGESLANIADDFKTRGLVSYSTLLDGLVRILGSDRHIAAGVYYFPRPENLITIAARLVGGDFETTPIKITVPEGYTVNQIAALLVQKIPNFDRRTFINAAQDKEGYLFPDTYFFMPGDSTGAILSVFSNGFNSHLVKVQPQLTAFNKSLPEVVTMASLLEKEASDTESRRTIAGILWHRISIGMPLQVDAVFPYFLHKSALELTSADLKVDNPYNTYINKGLPPGPIGNPGLDSIRAAATPIKSNYLYYLSDKDGNFHYAATYAQFLVYKHKYIGS